MTAVSSVRALSQTGVGPSGRHIEEVDSEDIEVVYSKEALGNVMAEVSQGDEGIEPSVELHPD